MKKIIYRSVFSLIILAFLFVVYLTIFGIETSKFNTQIENKLKTINKDFAIQLNRIKLVLDPLKFQLKAKTLGPKFKYKNKSIDLENIQTKISLKSLLEDQFSLENLIISTKSLDIRNLVSIARSINTNTELFILENFIKKGYLIADLNLNFDEKGNLKDNFIITGLVKDTKIDIFKKYKIDNLDLIFDMNNQSLNLQDIKLSLNDLNFLSKKISISKKEKNKFEFQGQLENKKITLNNESIDKFFDLKFLENKVQELTFSSKNYFSFFLDQKFRIEKYDIRSEIDIDKFLISNRLFLKKFFPEIKKNFLFTNHELKVNFQKNNFNVTGSGDVLFQNKQDSIKYTVDKKKNVYHFDTLLKIKDNPFNLNFLGFEKKKDTLLSIKVKGNKKLKEKIKFNSIFMDEEDNKIEIQNLILSKNLKIIDLNKANFHFIDKKSQINKFNFYKKNNEYFLEGSNLNADDIIENLISDSENPKILDNDFKVYLKLDKILFDENHNLKNFKGNLFIKDQQIIDGSLTGLFSKNKKFVYTVKSLNNEIITTLFVDRAESLVDRYKFIKGFKGGELDFYSSKNAKESFSKIKIYNFKLKELPALTKLLTLASLQGIADLLSGEGIGFNEFEMSFKNKKDVMIIEEIYAIGPAISILMDGYIEKNKLISLRGTLVPATTINKAIGNIPILGKILVGSKTGEGVFGVSFKIKGPPKNLETTVNPIKTLTPRFITRTLEKIKKN